MKSATLSASLLAQKGQAVPTQMRPKPHPTLVPKSKPGLGDDHVAADEMRVPQRDSANLDAEPDIDTVTATAARRRISIRLDPKRHRAIKLLAAHRGETLQELILRALDGQLEELAKDIRDGRCDCLIVSSAEMHELEKDIDGD